MSWVAPPLKDQEFSLPPPKKKSRVTTETVGICIEDQSKTSSFTNNWLNKYKAKQISELPVHINKVKELENRLLHSTNKLLLLTGPTGCGKTSTLEIVCKNMGFKILEWITPVDKFDSPVLMDRGRAKQFEEFLLKSSRYGSCLDTKIVRAIILVKDIPHVFLDKPSAFHEMLENISMSLKNPVVFICSDNSLCRKLFLSKNGCQLSIIRFNSITNLQMLKILKTIVHKEKDNKDITILCDKSLSTICSLSKGDVRNAVTELYFRCVKPSCERSPSKPQMTEKSKDSHVDFFHGIGKVFSPRKITTKESYKFTTTPETLVDNFLGESKDFVNRLNENFYTKFTNIYDLSNAAQRLATSDILLAQWQEREIFHEYALSLAIRGTMLTNTRPQEPSFQLYGKQGTYHSEKIANLLCLEGKSLFPDLCGLDYQCLIDIIPYSKFLLGNLSSLQKDYLKKTLNF